MYFKFVTEKNTVLPSIIFIKSHVIHISHFSFFEDNEKDWLYKGSCWNGRESPTLWIWEQNLLVDLTASCSSEYRSAFAEKRKLDSKQEVGSSKHQSLFKWGTQKRLQNEQERKPAENSNSGQSFCDYNMLISTTYLKPTFTIQT